MEEKKIGRFVLSLSVSDLKDMVEKNKGMKSITVINEIYEEDAQVKCRLSFMATDEDGMIDIKNPIIIH